MSLLRLLKAGRSLVGGNNSDLRYRMTNPKAMPKFGAKGNPFRSTATPEPATEEAAPATPMLPAAAPEPVAEQPEAAPAAVAEEVVASSAPVAESAAAAPAPAAAKGAQKAPGWLAGWGARVSGWLPGARRKPGAPAVPRFEKGPVQTELSLDRIKVVRNDLSDADLEIVPAKPAPEASRKTEKEAAATPEPGAAAGAAEKAEPEKAGAVRSSWERASELFGAERAE